MTAIDPFAYWKAAVAGEKPRCYVDSPEQGFFRKALKERNEKGNSRRVGWTPVAVFLNGNVLTGRVGVGDDALDITGDRLNELWSYIATNAITEDAYRAVAERGQDWPDAHDASKNAAAEAIPQDALESIERGEFTDLPSLGDSRRRGAIPEKIITVDIAVARTGVSQYTVGIDSDEQSSRALSLKNELTRLAGDLDKHRMELVRPHIDAQQEINGRLNPIIKDAKSDCGKIIRALEAWEDVKRRQQQLAEEAVLRDRRIHEEAVAKAAAEGNTAPVAGPVLAHTPNAPPPSTKIVGAVGRAASVKQKTFVVSIDEDAAFAQFKGNAELSALLMTLAQRAIDAGIPVPGAVTEQKSVVR